MDITADEIKECAMKYANDNVKDIFEDLNKFENLRFTVEIITFNRNQETDNMKRNEDWKQREINKLNSLSRNDITLNNEMKKTKIEILRYDYRIDMCNFKITYYNQKLIELENTIKPFEDKLLNYL